MLYLFYMFKRSCVTPREFFLWSLFIRNPMASVSAYNSYHIMMDIITKKWNWFQYVYNSIWWCDKYFFHCICDWNGSMCRSSRGGDMMTENFNWVVNCFVGSELLIAQLNTASLVSLLVIFQIIWLLQSIGWHRVDIKGLNCYTYMWLVCFAI